MHRQLIRFGFVLSLALAGTAGMAAGNKALELPAAGKAQLTKESYQAAKVAIAREFAQDTQACARLRADAKPVCDAQAKGREKAESAKLEARWRPTPDNVEAAKFAVADANYEVALQKCAGGRDGAKARCKKQAKAAREAAKRQARVEKVQATGGIYGENAPERKQPKASPS